RREGGGRRRVASGAPSDTRVECHLAPRCYRRPTVDEVATIGTAPTGAPAGDVSVRLERVSKHFGSFVAVDAVELDVQSGEFFSLLGPSGSGKTTCLRMIAGFERPTSGRVLLDGSDVTDRAPYERDVNTVFQDYALFPHMTVQENIEYGLRVKRVAKAERRERAGEALALVRLSEFAQRKPSQLSGGQRQRVALARALVNRPGVLLLDEPLGALDLKLRQEMQIELKHIQQTVGITFIYVTHDQEEALSMSDRLAVFNQGAVEQIGSPSEVYERPATSFVANFVGTSNVLGDGTAVRPEKLRLEDTGYRAQAGEEARSGTIEDVVYLGPITRYVVRLEDGSALGVLAQNLAQTSTQVRAAQGRPVEVVWNGSHAVAITTERTSEENG
ncbi:MAG: putative spermidine/putrescine transport system ATP-binding protein, partial [Gaiellales bacterium]|nr:putative spermidine/putrescine transport system ATP-binding protein [Gaiellales bacterium]